MKPQHSSSSRSANTRSALTIKSGSSAPTSTRYRQQAAPSRSGGSSPNYTSQWLQVLKHAEGTTQKSYSTAFSGVQYNNNQPHPGTVYTSKSGRQSAAHGAYQFMPDTWRDANGGQNVPMTKENQDKAAIWLIQQRGGFDPATTPISRAAVNKLAGTWASFPNAQGKSNYGQPVKNYQELERVFNQVAPKPRMNTPNQQGHFNPNSVNKMGPTYSPNSNMDRTIVAPKPIPPSGGPNAADFLDKPDFLQDKDYVSPVQRQPVGGLPGLHDIAQAGIGNYDYFKTRGKRYGEAAFSSNANNWSKINNRSYGGGMDLGRDLGITNGPAYRAVTNSGYTWGSTAGAANAWKGSYGYS